MTFIAVFIFWIAVSIVSPPLEVTFNVTLALLPSAVEIFSVFVKSAVTPLRAAYREVP